jgi:outer membrane biosynthesis protein TonB
MFATKNRSPMQLVYQLTAIILVVLLLVSCSGNVPSGKDKPDDEGKPSVTTQPDKQQDANPEQQPEEKQDAKPEQQPEGKQGSNPEQQPDEKQDANSEQKQDTGLSIPGSPGTAAESFNAYMQAKRNIGPAS